MAAQDILPKRLSKCNIPICPVCLYGKSTKRAWQDKPSTNAIKPLCTQTPGAIVSVDMMTSPTPGLIAQMTGSPTYRRYLHAAVYVDQATGYSFIWLQKSISEEETLEGKMAFERLCRSFIVNISHYHADNGIFAANGWRQSCNSERQTVSYAGVNAHHQNGVAERRI
jgi:hypothetical protein